MGADARVDILLNLKAQLAGFDGSAAAVDKLSGSVSKAGATIKQQARTMGDDVEHMGERLKKAFDPGNLAKGFLAGAGIGSGLALVSMTIEKWAPLWKEYWQTSAEYAKEMEASVHNIAEAMQATAKAAKEAFLGTLSPQQQLATREQDVATISAKMLELRQRRERSVAGVAFAEDGSNISRRVMSFDGEKFGNGDTGLGAKDFADLMQKRADEAQINWNKARDDLIKAQVEVAKLKKDIADVAAKTAEATNKGAAEQRVNHQFDGRISPEDEAKGVLEIRKRLAQQDEDYRKKDMDAAIERARIAKLSEPLEQNRSLMALNEMTPDEAVAAADAAKKALAQVSIEGKAFDREMAGLWNNVSDRAGQAFAEILIDGTNTFRDLARTIVQSMAEIAIRMSVVNPLLNAVFSGFAGFAHLPTFGDSAPVTSDSFEADNRIVGGAGGSFVTNGRTHFTVGDNPGGIEHVQITPLSGVGRSSINGRSISMAGGGRAVVGGGGGDTFNFEYNFAQGVSRGEVLALLPTLVAASKNAVLEAKRRRSGGF